MPSHHGERPLTRQGNDECNPRRGRERGAEGKEGKSPLQSASSEGQESAFPRQALLAPG